MLTSVGESLYLTNHDPEIAMILKAVFVDWIRYSSIFFREIKCSGEREKERKLLSVNQLINITEFGADYIFSGIIIIISKGVKFFK